MADVIVDLAMNIPEDHANDLIQHHSYSEILAWLVGLSMQIQDWHSITAESGELPIVELISRRIEQLEHNLASLGVDVQNWGMIDGELQEDKSALQELSVCILEGKWQLNAIAQEVIRKWEKLCPQHHNLQKRIWDWVHSVNTA
mgnify:FL=1